MKTYLICYDLNKEGQNYQKLIEEIKAITDIYWHHLDSTWIIRSEANAKTICNQLKKYMDSNDELLVSEITKSSCDWTGFNKRGTDWLEKYIK